MQNEKITIENVNTPGQNTNVRADKYNDMCDALLKILPTAPNSLTYTDMRDAAKLHLCADLFPNGKTAGWWAKTVQLDLEAKGRITRLPTKPLTFQKTLRPISPFRNILGVWGLAPNRSDDKVIVNSFNKNSADQYRCSTGPAAARAPV
jgi:hypothetical protein